MKPRLPDPSSPVAPYISAFLAHKRALNRKYHVEEMALRLLDRHLNRVGIKTLADVTPEVLDTFFLGRPRNRPRSFNHLVGVVGRLFEWMLEHEIIDRSPVTTQLRRPGRTRPPCIFDLPTAQRLVDIAAGLPDTNKGCAGRAMQRSSVCSSALVYVSEKWRAFVAATSTRSAAS